MRVVECEYQYFLLTIKCLIPCDAILDKVLEPTATGKKGTGVSVSSHRQKRLLHRAKSERLVIFSFCAAEETEGNVATCAATRLTKDT